MHRTPPRPANGVHLRLPRPLLSRLDEHAARLGLNRCEVARHAIAQWLGQPQQQPLPGEPTEAGGDAAQPGE